MTSTSRDSTGSRQLGRDARRLIAVDLPEHFRSALPRRLVDDSFDEVHYVAFAALEPEIFKLHAPDTVIAPLLTKTFDAVELADYLSTLEFRGLLIIVSDVLPNPALVKKEIGRCAPQLALELFEMNSQSSLREV